MLFRSSLPLLLAFALISFTSCSKKNKSDVTPPPPVEEEALKFEVPEIQVGKYNIAMDSTYTFKVNVTSRMPEKGVRVELNVATDPAGIPLGQTEIPDTKEKTFSITLRHLKELKPYKVTVTLSSLGNTANISTPTEFFITNKKSL
ncbi:MAG TPA: hypothetical protein VM802_06595 [Chitinophaga sp.]|uniref:hypothetical protein n=1 Tax=Chitinophaga sp. TaxID=1869181 RepID=UPI002CCAA2AC|nr:hypothetical protein [Chitinophaga sp.]HVI44517.1 hypothetical protein [Chitinophaga sp.]